MKKLVLIVFVTLSCLAADAQMFATRNGEKCIVHDIEAGNTLYGISKIYAVQINHILDSNPWVNEGLSVGETLFIPVKYVNKKEAKKSPKLEGNVLMHTVRKGETMYSLSKKYKIDINELTAANPALADGLKKGMTLRVPTEKVQLGEAQVAPAAQDSLQSHLVGTGETLYSISLMYDVAIDDIKKVNGGMPEGLKKGNRIRIPKLRDDYVPSQATTSALTTDSILTSPISQDLGFVSQPMPQVNLGLMLPFSINTQDMSDPESKEGVYQLTDIAFEFYRGVEMALDDLTKQGLSTEVIVFDVEKKAESGTQATDKPAFDELDLIIGPLHRASFASVAKRAELKGIPTVSPLTKNPLVIKGHKHASKVVTGERYQAEYLAKYMYFMHAGDTVILFKSNHEKDKLAYIEFKKSWNQISQSEDSLGTTLVEFALDAYDEEKFLALLNLGAVNAIAAPSNQRPFVSDLMSKLNSSSYDEHEITVYGLQSWLRFDNIDAATKNRFNMRLCSSMYLDYDERDTKSFLKDFYARYKTIPSAQGYALTGYDITTFYLSGIHEHGKEFINNLDKFQAEGLKTGFDFERSPSGGWENKYCFILKYDDYNLVREN